MFLTQEEYIPPNTTQISQLVEAYGAVEEQHINNTRARIDNRDAIRMYLWLRGVSDDVFKKLVEPYDIGFYRKCDGKSHPVRWLRVPRFLKHLGFKLDMGAVRHDLDYYLGMIPRKEADRFYRQAQIELGNQPWTAYSEYIALRLFGWYAWNQHRKKQGSTKGYGTLDYIKSLPNLN